MKPTEWIWQNGQFVAWADATTHVMSHALHYGSSVFEGIRSYAAPKGPVFFRLEDHIDRLLASSRIYAMTPSHTRDELVDACHAVVSRNGLESAYIRPLVYRGEGGLGLRPADNPVDVIIGAFEWAHYHDESAAGKGIDVRVVSWQRAAPNTLPMLAKAGGNYLSGQLIAAEAHRDGYHEGIALDVDGYVSEGSGQNVFVVRDGVIYTPTAASSILPGLTRDAVMQLASELGFEVREERLMRELLLISDEIFLVGTATEIAPVRSVDRRPVGDGRPGPMTTALQRAYTDLIEGRRADRRGYLTPVHAEVPR